MSEHGFELGRDYDSLMKLNNLFFTKTKFHQSLRTYTYGLINASKKVSWKNGIDYKGSAKHVPKKQKKRDAKEGKFVRKVCEFFYTHEPNKKC